MQTIELLDSEFNPFEQLQKHQIITKAVGAQSIFVGYMRDFREHQHVDKMVIHHYSPMTEQQLNCLAETLSKQYGLLDFYIAHRVGEVFPTSPLVVIAATASHRTNAITAVSKMLEDLKHTVPFWKQEYCNNHSQWVGANTDNRIK